MIGKKIVNLLVDIAIMAALIIIIIYAFKCDKPISDSGASGAWFEYEFPWIDKIKSWGGNQDPDTVHVVHEDSIPTQEFTEFYIDDDDIFVETHIEDSLYAQHFFDTSYLYGPVAILPNPDGTLEMKYQTLAREVNVGVQADFNSGGAYFECLHVNNFLGIGRALHVAPVDVSFPYQGDDWLDAKIGTGIGIDIYKDVRIHAGHEIDFHGNHNWYVKAGIPLL